MRKKLMPVLAALALLGLLTGCYTNIHKIGTGAAGSNVSSQAQWYFLFGLVPMTQVDSNAMAAGATNYSIQTQMTFIDGLISAITFDLIGARHVTVTK